VGCCDGSVHAAIWKTVVEIWPTFHCACVLEATRCLILHDGCGSLLSQMIMGFVRYAVLRDTFTVLVRRVHLPGAREFIH
jgi:hypothetical protein